jgi:hypothetical protein
MATVRTHIKNRLLYGPLERIVREFHQNPRWDTWEWDSEIGEWICARESFPFAHGKPDRLGILATSLHDTGGHTESIVNLVASLPPETERKVFLSRLDVAWRTAPKKRKRILEFARIEGAYRARSLFQKITEFAPQAIVAFIHPDDIVTVQVLALLKKYSDIKILFYNHASDLPCLGMSFADLILDSMPSTTALTREERHLANTTEFGFFGPRLEDLQVEGAPQFLTMSGCAAHKIFEGEESPYLELVRRLLERHGELRHVLLANLDTRQKNILSNIFKNSSALERLTVLAPSANYKSIFKSACVFIDSFPESSDLTMIDLMGLKIPFVSMVSEKNPLFAFHEFLPPGYPYLFKTVQDMEHGIETLLQNASEREKVVESNFRYFLEHFEGKNAARKIMRILENL